MSNSAEANAADAAERLRLRERDIAEYAREEPLTALAIAGGLGFIMGGGARSRIGLALLTIAGRIAVRGAAADFMAGFFSGHRDRPKRERAKARSRNSGNDHYDD